MVIFIAAVFDLSVPLQFLQKLGLLILIQIQPVLPNLATLKLIAPLRKPEGINTKLVGEISLVETAGKTERIIEIEDSPVVNQDLTG